VKPTDQNNNSGKGNKKAKGDPVPTAAQPVDPTKPVEPAVMPAATPTDAEANALLSGASSATPASASDASLTKDSVAASASSAVATSVAPSPAPLPAGSPVAGAAASKDSVTRDSAGKDQSSKPEPSSSAKSTSKPAAGSPPPGSVPPGSTPPGGSPPGGTPPRPATVKPGPGRGVSALALLVALAALGLSGLQWYQTDQRQASEAALSEQVAQLQAAQEQNQQQLEARLEGLPTASEWQQIEGLSADLQRSQQAVSQRLDTLQGDAQSDWKLAEAEYLLRLASLRLLASQDITSARELLSAVDNILQNQPDSGVFAVREQLAQFQGELSSLPEIDRAGVYLRLAAMREQVTRLVALPVPVFDPEELSVEEEYEDRLARRTRAERVLMRLERYVRVDFQRGKVITPLLDEAELQRVQRTLQLTMEQAQWAALRGESDVYTSSLEQADGMLRQYFELENPQVQAMQSQLESLAEQEVSLSPPDLSPLQQGLAAYIQSRRSLATGNGEASE
tara:strand:- start:69387 stop:70913 length:1527 start_codon:yes stop_codon:yes gene_type:complete